MAYATTNPPRLISQSVGASAGSLWYYASADNTAAVRVAGYFTDGYSLGIRAGDFMFQVDTDDFAGATMICAAATDDTDVDFTDGAVIAATNTD